MAINNTTKDFSSMEFPMEIKRQDAFALDPTSVWKSLEEAQSYAQNNPTAYIGQVIAVVAEGVADIYKIKDEAGTLEKVGSDKDSEIETLTKKVSELEKSQTEQDSTIDEIKANATQLETNIGDETNRATAKENEIQENLSTEIEERKESDTTLQAAIESEVEARETAISGLQQQISGLETSFEEDLAKYLPLSGGKMTGSVDMGNNIITNVSTPTNDTDSANKKYVDDKATQAINDSKVYTDTEKAKYLLLTGGAMKGPIATSETEFEDNELVTKRYVDGGINGIYKALVDGGINGIYKALVDGGNTTKLFYSFLELPDNKNKQRFEVINDFGQIIAEAWADKTYTLRFYKASVSGDYTGTPLDDLADGRQAAPLVTDNTTIEDWTENDPMTWYIRANALSLADGTMNILAFEGENGFDITGETAPVYCFALNLYLKHSTDDSYKYVSWKTVKAEGYESMAEGIAPDSSYRTITWHPAFFGGLNTAGGITSGANKKPVIWTSAQDALPLARKITPYEGLWTDCDQQYVLSQWQLRHWTLENSGVLEGCTRYNYQYTLAVAETDVKRVIVTKEQGKNFIVGSNVCLGERGVNESIDRNQAYNHDIIQIATITSIENVNISEVEYTALNLDIDSPITTTTTMFLSTMPWSSGTTESLYNHSDGSITSVTNGFYPCRVAGIEMLVGTNIEMLDPLWQASIVDDHWKYEVYSCRDSEKQASSITGDYQKTGEFSLTSAAEYTWFYIKDMNELEAEAMIPTEFGGSDSTYYRSAVRSTGGSGGLRSPWRGGSLYLWGLAGFVFAYGSYSPGSSLWAGGGRLTGAGKKRGESAP